ncbi:Acyltransferase [Aphelenchoides bicaudatus]|nr:Acyltransferase [Aphelenchoides bicaudatus]
MFVTICKDWTKELPDLLNAAWTKWTNEAAQLLAVAIHVFLWIVLPLISFWLPGYILLCTRFWPLMIFYAIWYVYDFKTPARGSRNWAFLKGSRIWKHFANYFPIKIVKTADLPSDRNYILGCHPHGVLSIGAFTHLCTEGTDFAKHFPGLEPNLLTLNGQFWFPFRREIGIGLGGVESSPRSLEYLLRSRKAGRIVGIVIGGAEEALDAHQGKNILNLRNRRGFCKFALRYGASLVPSYSFGENDVFNQSGNNRETGLRAIQRRIKKLFGFCPPLFSGSGLFSAKFGLMPKRHPITTVFGAPIHVKKSYNPSEKELDQLHKRYTDSLIALFEEHKISMGLAADAQLTIH